MNLIPRKQFLELLSGEWAAYVPRCRQFSPAELQAFLQQQGYANLTGLLGHVVAWWQDGQLTVQRMLQEPAYQNPDYDVDSFNAQAVEKFGGLDEPQMVALFEQQREKMRALVESLSDSQLADERINNRLFYEIVYHIQEHVIES